MLYPSQNERQFDREVRLSTYTQRSVADALRLKFFFYTTPHLDSRRGRAGISVAATAVKYGCSRERSKIIPRVLLFVNFERSSKICLLSDLKIGDYSRHIQSLE